MLEDKAKELGRMIGQSAEYQAVKRAQDSLAADRDASTLLREMEKIQVDAQRMIERGEQPTVEMQQNLEALFERTQGNPVYQRMAVAQENFEKLMMQVNHWITDGIKKGSASPIITLG